ncbi:MAG: hypothetical protein ACLP7P_09735 [Rhodomicrobium sp.]
MSDQPPAKAIFAAFLGTAQGKIITSLTITALLLGIAAEGVSLVTGYYKMGEAGADMEAATGRDLGRTVGRQAPRETLKTINVNNWADCHSPDLPKYVQDQCARQTGNSISNGGQFPYKFTYTQR